MNDPEEFTWRTLRKGVRAPKKVSKTTSFPSSSDKNFKHGETNLKEICQGASKKYFSQKKVLHVDM